MVDTPGWTSGRFGKEEAARVEQKIWGTTVSSFNGLVSQSSETESIFEASSDHGSDHPTITVTHPLLSEPDESQTHVIHSQNQAGEGETINLPTLLLHTPRDVRRPMLIVCCAMLGQQLSGINAILYYSNEILSKSLPEFGPYVSLGITVVNVIMTFPPIILIEVRSTCSQYNVNVACSNTTETGPQTTANYINPRRSSLAVRGGSRIECRVGCSG